jgi:hypothetical protein
MPLDLSDAFKEPTTSHRSIRTGTWGQSTFEHWFKGNANVQGIDPGLHSTQPDEITRGN